MLSTIPSSTSSGFCRRPPGATDMAPPTDASGRAPGGTDIVRFPLSGTLFGSTICSGRNQKYFPYGPRATLSLCLFQTWMRHAMARPMPWTMKVPETLVRGSGTGAAVLAAAALRTERATQGALKLENWVLTIPRCVGVRVWVRWWAGRQQRASRGRDPAGAGCCSAPTRKGLERARGPGLRSHRSSLPPRLVRPADDGGADEGAHGVDLHLGHGIPHRNGIEAFLSREATRGERHSATSHDQRATGAFRFDGISRAEQGVGCQ